MEFQTPATLTALINVSYQLIATDFYNTSTDLLRNASQSNLTRTYYDPAYILVGMVTVTFVLVAGLAGNIMVVVVVARSKGMRTPTNCYLASLAAADFLLLLTAPLPTLVELNLPRSETPNVGLIGCSLMVFAQYLGVNTSALSIIAFTVERYSAVCHPLRSRRFRTVRRAVRIAVFLWFASICYCSPWLFLVTVKEIPYSDNTFGFRCDFKLSREQYVIFYVSDLALFYFLPLVVTSVLYMLVARVLVFHSSSRNAKAAATATRQNSTVPATAGSAGSRRTDKSSTAQPMLVALDEREKIELISREDGGREDVAKKSLKRVMFSDALTASSSASAGKSCSTSEELVAFPMKNLNQIREESPSSCGTSKSNLERSSGSASLHSSRIQATKMLVAVVASFVILWLPYRAYVVYNSFARKRYESVWLMLFCRLMVYTNSAINPILYSAFSQKFRRAFVRLISRKGAWRRSSGFSESTTNSRPSLATSMSSINGGSWAANKVEHKTIRVTASTD